MTTAMGVYWFSSTLFLLHAHIRNHTNTILTLKVLVTTIDVQWEGMGNVGSARYEPALLPPCPTIRALNCSNKQIFRNSAL